MQRATAILLLSATLGACATAATGGAADGWRDGLEPRLEEQLNEWRTPGGAVVVVAADRPLLVHPVGRRSIDAEAPFGADTLFPIASNTKTFTAAAIGVLVDRGALSFDDVVVKHYPELATVIADPERARQITIRDLLTHRSGLPEHGIDAYIMPRFIEGRPCTKADLFAWSGQNLKPAHGLREADAYSNFGYVVLAEVVERVSGEPWAAFVQEAITRPLGMTSTVFGDAAFRAASNRTALHELDPEGDVAPTDVVDMGDCMDGSGGIMSTPHDLGRYLRMYLNGGELDGTRVLSETTTAELLARQSDMPMHPFQREHMRTTWRARTLGWEAMTYKGTRLVRMGGFGPGYQSALMLLPERRLGVVVLQSFAPAAFILTAGNEVLDRLLGVERTDWETVYRPFFPRIPDRQAMPVPADTLADYVGTYSFEGFPRRIAIEDGKLYLFGNNPVGGGPPLVGKSRLFGLGPDALFIKTGDGVFRFVRDDTGTVIGFDETFGGERRFERQRE